MGSEPENGGLEMNDTIQIIYPYDNCYKSSNKPTLLYRPCYENATL